MQHFQHALITVALATSSTLASAQTLPPPPVSPVPVIHYEYDAQGNLTKTTAGPAVPGLNLQTTTTYDRLDRPKDQTDPRLGKTQFQHNGQDRLTQVTDPRNLVTQTPTNGLGNNTKLTSPDTGTAVHTFDVSGNLTTRTDSRGVKTTITYDALDRPTQIAHTQTGQPTLTFTNTYDQTGPGYAYGIGKLTSTSSPAASSQYLYNDIGWLITDTQRIKPSPAANPAPISLPITYAYNPAGKPAGITYPSGRKLTYVYTSGTITSLTLAPSAAATTAAAVLDQLTWQAFGPPNHWRWPTLQTNPKIYDLSGRMIRYRLGSHIRDITFDAANRITNYTHYNATTAAPLPALNQTFSYNPNSQLTQVTTATASWSIAYDPSGNRTAITLNGQTSLYTIPATSNRLTAATSPAVNYTQDPAGNTTADTAKNYTATYDLSGRLATATKAGITTTYHHDNFGRRIRKYSTAGPTSTTVFAYDKAGHLLGEYDHTGKPLREYIWLGDTPVAMFTPDPVATNPPVIYSIHTDHLNTPRVVTDKNNKVRWRWLAEPFGTTAPETNPEGLGVFTQPLRFPGQYFDQETGLNYNWHRDYDPATGRYVQSDPIGIEGGLNTYAYVEGNPASLIDPYGLETCLLTTVGPGGIRDHAAVFTSSGDGSGGPAIYDPAGAYGPANQAGSGDLVIGNIASIKKYMDFHKQQKVESTCKMTSQAEEESIINKAISLPSAIPFQCAVRSSTALSGQQSFPNVKAGTFFPGNLLRQVRKGP
jgi:RHS repeat-associated protein